MENFRKPPTKCKDCYLGKRCKSKELNRFRLDCTKKKLTNKEGEDEVA